MCQSGTMTALIILFFVAVWAGIQNALAGGGTFLTLPALMLTGMTALAANITSTIALFPGQITSSWGGRGHVAGAGGLSFRALVVISLAGGIVGAVLLLVTPSDIFKHLVPWLVLFATSVFAYGSFVPRKADHPPVLGKVGAGAAQFCIAVYGGYFGGGIGFLMLAALDRRGPGHPQRQRHQECAGRRDERLGGGDLCFLAPGALAAGGHRLCRRGSWRGDRRPYGQPGQSEGFTRGSGVDRYRPDNRAFYPRALTTRFILDLCWSRMPAAIGQGVAHEASYRRSGFSALRAGLGPDRAGYR